MPNLWELLKNPEERVTNFYVGSWEMDPVNVGFVTDAGPATSELVTSMPANSNSGHDYGTDLSDTRLSSLSLIHVLPNLHLLAEVHISPNTRYFMILTCSWIS